MLTLDDLSKLVPDPDAAYIDLPNNGCHGWGDGYLVEAEGRFHLISVEWDSFETFPSCVRSREDAVAFVKAASEWFQAGRKDGEREAKRFLRNWLKED